jgi:hypothetical protein
MGVVVGSVTGEETVKMSARQHKREIKVRGTETPDLTSCSKFVLVNEPTQQIVSSNAHALSRPRSRLGPRVRRVEPQGPMWPSPL